MSGPQQLNRAGRSEIASEAFADEGFEVVLSEYCYVTSALVEREYCEHPSV